MLVSQTIGITLSVVAGLVLVGVVLSMLARKCTAHVETVKRYLAAAKPETKIKIIAGFYMLVSKVDSVYEVSNAALSHT